MWDRSGESHAGLVESGSTRDIRYRPTWHTSCSSRCSGGSVGRGRNPLRVLGRLTTGKGAGVVLRRGPGQGRPWPGRWNGRRLRPSRPADRFLLGVGFACVIGAIVAGSLKCENIELPAVTSPLRQALLGGFGALLIAASLLVRTRDDTTSAATTDRPLVPVPGAVPPATRYFTGRVEPLAELDRLLQAEGLVVLTGLGGVGKTQLALAWLGAHRQEFQVVWWVRAELETTLTEDLAALADHQHLGEPTATLADKLAVARRWLDETPRWLLVFDNATSADMLAPYLPTGPGRKIVVTSQERRWPYATVEVAPWPRAEAVVFLAAHSPADQHVAGELAELLGELPLALEQARAYLAAPRPTTWPSCAWSWPPTPGGCSPRARPPTIRPRSRPPGRFRCPRCAVPAGRGSCSPCSASWRPRRPPQRCWATIPHSCHGGCVGWSATATACTARLPR